ncbi:MAG TPA: tetratricopeptide repeat protein [Bacteroidales bacterium]
MNSKLKLFLIFLFLATSIIQIFSQERRQIDSLKTLLTQVHEPADKIEVYSNLVRLYKNINTDTATEMARQALLLAEKTNDDLNIGLIHAELADIAMVLDEVESAELNYKLAIEYLKEQSDANQIIRVYLMLGNRYLEKSNYPEAMECYLNGIRTSEQMNDSTLLANLYNNLGIVYLNIDKPEQALSLYSKALNLFEKKKDSANIAGITTNIGSIYIQLKDPEIARSYYLKGLEIFKSTNNQSGLAHAYFKLGLLDEMQEKHREALANLSQSLELQKQIIVNSSGSKTMFLVETNIHIGITFLELGEIAKAKEYLISGYEKAMQTKQLSLIALSAKNLSKLYRASKDFENALNYYEVYKQFSDSIYNEENIRQLTLIELQYQYDTKLQEAELQRKLDEQKHQRQNLIYLLILGSLLLLLIIVILLLKLENNKKRKIAIERKSLSEKLEYTSKELTTYVMYLLRKNEFIMSISEKMKKLMIEAKPENKRVMKELISELQSNTDMVSWEEFEVRFQQVYTDFYKKLTDNFPDLSPNELRLCAFFRLNMTTKEIAAITYQSLNSIKVGRFRLRKKLGLSKEDNLVSFLSKF